MGNSRIVVVEKIYHQLQGEQPIGCEHQYSQELRTDEQPYERRCVATEEWQPLDCGWLEDVSMLHIVNEEGQFKQVNPTDEERAEAAKKILEVGHYLPHECSDWLILPGQSMRGCPMTAGQLHIRCRSGKACYRLRFYPA